MATTVEKGRSRQIEFFKYLLDVTGRMLSSRQRIVVYLLAALSATMLLHAHAALESSSTHCAICIQQSHGIVEQTIEVPRDEQVRVVTTGDDLAAPALDLSRTASPRAPPG